MRNETSDRKDKKMHRLQQDSKVVGTKQTLKALEKGIVNILYIAEDAQRQLVSKLIKKAEDAHIPIVYVKTMEELGKACDVEVKTATAALIVNN